MMRSTYRVEFLSSLESQRRMLKAIAFLAVCGAVSLLTAISSPALLPARLSFTLANAAETSPKGDEDYSGWDWDEITIESQQSSSIDQGDAVTEKTEILVDEAEEPNVAAPTKEEAKSQQATSEGVQSQQTQVDKEEASGSSQAEDVGDGGLDLDLDWSEGFEIEDAEVGADQNASRRDARREKMARLANKPRVSSTAEPDFGASILEGYQLFPDMRPYFIIPSKKDPDMHPCLDCHDWAESDLTPRLLKEPHDNFRLQHGLHGKGEFWCLTCHHLEGDGGLKTFEGVKLSFDEAYILCSQCHSQEAKDWAFGAHGKRVDNWRGERRILNCTACHYQHRPGYDPRKPMAKPPLRMGLVRPGHPAQDGTSPTHRHKTEKVWERYSVRIEGGE